MPKTWEDIPGWYDWATAYEDAVKHFPSGSTFVEVGCYLGRSLCHLGQLVKESGKNIRVVGVDWCRGSGVENGNDNHAAAIQAAGGSLAGVLHKNILDCGLGGVIDLMVMDSVSASRYFGTGSVDMVFLDAIHTRQGVEDDIQSWLPKVSPLGWLAGDDLCPVWPGVQEAVDHLLPGWHKWSHDSWRYLRG